MSDVREIRVPLSRDTVESAFAEAVLREVVGLVDKGERDMAVGVLRRYLKPFATEQQEYPVPTPPAKRLSEKSPPKEWRTNQK